MTNTPHPPTPWDDGSPSGPHGTGEDNNPGRCHARSKSTGNRCAKLAMRGQKVCAVHGGRSRQALASAQRRLAAEKVEADVRAAIAYESREGVSDPFAALAELADEALAMKEALAARVNSLTSLRYSAAGAGTEQLRAEVALYERAMDRSAKFLDILLRSGFEDRRLRLTEKTGAAVAMVLRGVLTELGHDVTPGSHAAMVAVRHLRAIDGPTVESEVVR